MRRAYFGRNGNRMTRRAYFETPTAGRPWLRFSLADTIRYALLKALDEQPAAGRNRIRPGTPTNYGGMHCVSYYPMHK